MKTDPGLGAASPAQDQITFLLSLGLLALKWAPCSRAQKQGARSSRPPQLHVDHTAGLCSVAGLGRCEHRTEASRGSGAFL